MSCAQNGHSWPPEGIRRIPSATHASLPAGIRDKCSCTRVTAAVSRSGRSCASTRSIAAVSNAGNVIASKARASRIGICSRAACSARSASLYIRVDVRPRLQCAKRVDGHAAHSCGRHGGRPGAKLCVVCLDSRDKGLELLIEGDALRPDDQLMEILTMPGLHGQPGADILVDERVVENR